MFRKVSEVSVKLENYTGCNWVFSVFHLEDESLFLVGLKLKVVHRIRYILIDDFNWQYNDNVFFFSKINRFLAPFIK